MHENANFLKVVYRYITIMKFAQWLLSENRVIVTGYSNDGHVSLKVNGETISYIVDAGWAGRIVDELRNIRNPSVYQRKAVDFLNTINRLVVSGKATKA